jgi:hypothetical protein
MVLLYGEAERTNAAVVRWKVPEIPHSNWKDVNFSGEPFAANRTYTAQSTYSTEPRIRRNANVEQDILEWIPDGWNVATFPGERRGRHCMMSCMLYMYKTFNLWNRNWIMVAAKGCGVCNRSQSSFADVKYRMRFLLSAKHTWADDNSHWRNVIPAAEFNKWLGGNNWWYCPRSLWIKVSNCQTPPN